MRENYLASLLLLDGFAKLADFVLELRDLRFDPLVLLIQPAFVLELHGERWDVGEVVVLAATLAAPLAALITPLTTLAAPLTLAAGLASLAGELSALAAPLIVVLSTPHEASTAAERQRHVHLLVIPRDGELYASAGLLIFDSADQIVAAAYSLAIDRCDQVALAQTGASRWPGRIDLRHHRALLIALVTIIFA